MSLVRRFLRYHEGQPFDATELLRTQFALDDSQYFSTVEVLPGGPRPRASHRAGQHRGRTRTAAIVTQFGVGYGTDTQVRGTAAWEDRRVNQHGHRFRAEIKARR